MVSLGSSDRSLDAAPSEEEEQNHSQAQVLPARCCAVLEPGGAVGEKGVARELSD